MYLGETVLAAGVLFCFLCPVGGEGSVEADLMAAA